MARTYGAIHSSVWKPGNDFRNLPMAAQWLYMVLVSQADLSPCGVLAMTVGRWSKLASDVSPKALREALQVLIERRYVVIDEDSEELLVRKFIKWDGGYRNENRRKALLRSVPAVASNLLVQVIAHELDALGVRHDIEIEGAPEDPSEGPPEARAGLGTYVTTRSQTKDLEPETGTIDRAQASPVRASEPETDPWLLTEFIDAYPKRVRANETRAAWRKACRKHDPTEIVRAARRFATDPNLPEPQWIPDAHRWLDRESWNDPPLPDRTPTRPRATNGSTTDARVGDALSRAAAYRAATPPELEGA